MTSSLRLDDYQWRAIRSDKTLKRCTGTDLPVLGLVGEIGSLLSEAKKKHRDARSYVGYEANVLEEMGDALWYLATIAAHKGVLLSSLLRQNVYGSDTCTFGDLQPQHVLPLAAPTIAFERTLLRLAGAVGRLAQDSTAPELADPRAVLSDILENLVEAANESGISLEQAATTNLEKTEDRWPAERVVPKLFDEAFPPEEQLPRRLEIEIYERTAGNGKPYVVQRCNGIFIGDRLTDNIMRPDDYRFHDAFHYAYAAILGWSPVTRALFRLKRKSETRVDEGQDGARAVLIEEGVATYVFGQAKNLDFFLGQAPGDLSFTFLKSVRQFVRGYEVESCPLWLWEEAILAGNQAFRYLKEHRAGKLQLDLRTRALKIGPLTT